MYLRAARRHKDGKTHVYWQLVRSVRHGRKVVQETVAHLGELDAEGRARAAALARSITGGGGADRQGDLFSPASEPTAVRLDRVRLPDDTIISGSENVHPREVEMALDSHPAVAEACVFGVPDERWGEAVAAWVQVREGALTTPEELTAHVRRTLAGFKVPRQIRIVADLPRSPAGKPLRRVAQREERARRD